MFTLLSTIGFVMLALWVLGLITSFTLGGGIHILLVIAVMMPIIWVIEHNT